MIKLIFTANTVGNGNCIVFLLQRSNPAKLTVKNSELIMDGAYCVGTNAEDWRNTHVEITIENSHIISQNNNGESVGLFVNVPAFVNILDSYIEGEQLGALLRGISNDSTHIATIKNTTITSKNTTVSEYQDKEWNIGIAVPSAALVVGNKSKTAYKNPTTVILDNVELNGGNGVDIYTYQNNESEKVVVAGTVKGECAVNEEGTRNGALVFPEAKIGDTYYQTLGNALSSINTTNEVTVDILVNNVKLEKALGEYLKQNDNNVVLKGNGLDKTILNLNYKDGDYIGYIGNSPSSNIVFKDLTLIHNPNNCNYRGFYDSGKKTFSKCKIIGKLFLYSKTEFTNCILENFKDYCIWTYGAKNVSFKDCTFETGGKAILVYNEKTDESFTADIVVTNCIFNDDGTLTGDDGLKAAIETGSNANNEKSNKYNLVLSNNVVNGFAINPKGTNTNSTLWANKNSMDAEHLTVTIDGNKIQ